MNQPHLAHRLARPAVLSLARREAALKDAARRLRRWPREGARPSLTAAPRLAVGCSGRDGKTALQPNRKTAMAVGDWRTTHALQKADMFTRHRQDAATAFVDLLMALQDAALACGDALHAIDVNPVILGAAGAIAVDALVVPTP